MTMGSTNAMLAQLIQDAVLKLCTQNVVFNRSLEIDGIICVSPGDEAKEIVVKMHRTIMKPMISQETPETTTNWSTENEQSSAYYPSNEAIESFPETLPQRPLHSTPTQRKRQMNNRDNVHRSATTTQPASPYVYNSRTEISPPVPTATQVTPGGVVVATGGLTIKEEPPSSPKRIKRSLSEDMQQDTPGHSTEKQPKLDQTPGATDNQNMDNINIKQEKEEPITIELGDDDDEEEDGGGGYDEDSTAGASWMGDDTLDTSANNQADQNTVWYPNLENSRMETRRVLSHTSPKMKLKRHSQVKEAEIDQLEDSREEPSTKAATKWSLNIFNGWLAENYEEAEAFEEMTPEELNIILKRFYASVRTSKGEVYSKSGLIAIRAGLQRHLINHDKRINIIVDRDFQSANNVLKGIFKKLRRDGNYKTVQKPAIVDSDMMKLNNYFADWKVNATVLVRKVFFDVCLHFGRRGREGLRKLDVNSFEVKVDESGHKYVEQTFSEYDETHKGVDPRETNKNPIMAASECVESFEFYLSKVNKRCSSFFQTPDTMTKNSPYGTWYTNRPIGHNTLSAMMSTISEAAGLSRKYTNHCIRVTCVTLLDRAGVKDRDIMLVTGHRNPSSLKHYAQAPTIEKKTDISNVLHGRKEEL